MARDMMEFTSLIQPKFVILSKIFKKLIFPFRGTAFVIMKEWPKNSEFLLAITVNLDYEISMIDENIDLLQCFKVDKNM